MFPHSRLTLAALLVLSSACTSLKGDAHDDPGEVTKDAGGHVPADTGVRGDAGADAAADATVDVVSACPACGAGFVCNRTVGVCEPCAPSPSDATELYVYGGSNGGTGTVQCPATTLTDALALAASSTSTAVKTIHVAAGVYDAAHGERFPLMVPGGVSVVGTGRTSTFVRGAAMYTGLAQAHVVTVVAGSSAGTATIAGLSLGPGGFRAPDIEYVGVYAERGDTSVTDAQIGPGYSFGVKLDSVRLETAKVSVTSSRFDGGNSPLSYSAGVFIAGRGCGSPWDHPPAAVAVPPFSATIGDGSVGGGNEFTNFRVSSLGVWATGCIDTLKVIGNTFSDSQRGGEVQIGDVDGAPRANVTIADNRFERLQGGLWIVASRGDVTLTNNTFRAIHALPGAATPGIAVEVLRRDVVAQRAYPDHLHVQGNVFAGNDVGLKLTGAFETSADIKLGDGNDFRCNSAPTAASFRGADVWLAGMNAGTATVDLGGNRWDRVTPAVAFSASFPNGADVAVDGSPAPAVSTAPSTASLLDCPADAAP